MNHPNKEQIAELANRYGRQVFHSAVRVLSDIHLAEDVTQEVFLKLFKKSASQFKNITHWSSYLKSMAVTTSIDQLRRQKRLAEETLDTQSDEKTDAASGPLSQTLSRQDLLRFQSALLRLTSQDAKVFCLRHIEGYAYQEIADLLNISKSLVGVTLHRSQQKLASFLGDSEFLGENHESRY